MGLKCRAVIKNEIYKRSVETKEDLFKASIDSKVLKSVISTNTGKHGNLKLKHGSSDTSFERAHLVELNSANRISKGLSNQKWRVVLGTHCEVHYALPFLTGSSYSDAVGGVSLY
ncbi:hypothetical protein J6590_038745 [Homalodisca vitripennis]|nr:hypothetical protein J6590_038745 [Homalodisca vitripennis]